MIKHNLYSNSTNFDLMPPALPCSTAEMLTAGKLSELACLTLYLMYEKKVGKKSFWYQYIKELDRQRARGVQAVESPLLWSDEELQQLLQGRV